MVVNELLRHFWGMLPINSEPKQQKLARIKVSVSLCGGGCLFCLLAACCLVLLLLRARGAFLTFPVQHASLSRERGQEKTPTP